MEFGAQHEGTCMFWFPNKGALQTLSFQDFMELSKIHPCIGMIHETISN